MFFAHIRFVTNESDIQIKTFFVNWARPVIGNWYAVEDFPNTQNCWNGFWSYFPPRDGKFLVYVQRVTKVADHWARHCDSIRRHPHSQSACSR